MARLPSLGALSLGPPTGPIAQYGQEVLEPSKRQKGDDGLTVSVVKWNADNEDQKRCLISLREFVPGEWVYKTPQGRPYDPWEMLKLWNAQEADRPNSQWFFNPSTNQYDIPRSEFVNDVDGGLSGWEQTHKESERPPSPEASPMDLAKLVHQPPPNPDGTAFVQRQQSRPQPGALFEPPHANAWQNMSYAGFRDLTRGFMSRAGGARGRTNRRASGWLTRWRTRLAAFFSSDRNQQRDNTSLWFTAGFVVGKITVGWYIQHETSSSPRVRATRSSSGSGHRVQENYLDVHCAVHFSFVGRDTPLGAQGSASALRKRMLSAFTGFRSDSDLRELARSISDADFRVYLGREGGAIAPTILPGGVRRRRPLNSDDKLGLSITITPRLVAAIEAGNIVPGRAIPFPGTAELVAAHYGAPKHAYATMAYPAYWPEMSGAGGPGPGVSPEAWRASKEKWKSIIAWFVRSLYTATVDARRDMYPFRSGTPLYLAGPHPPALDELVRYYTSPDAATLPAQSLANDVVDGNYAEWENDVGEEEVEDSEYHQWVDVPFWFAEAVVDAEAALRNPIQDN